jgi:hypothetical protein
VIPSIQDIVRGIKDGTIGFNQACQWIEQHVAQARETTEDEEERRYFAALAMQAMVTADYRHGNDGFGYTIPNVVASNAVACADALLKALNPPHAEFTESKEK